MQNRTWISLVVLCEYFRFYKMFTYLLIVDVEFKQKKRYD